MIPASVGDPFPTARVQALDSLICGVNPNNNGREVSIYGARRLVSLENVSQYTSNVNFWNISSNPLLLAQARVVKPYLRAFGTY